MPAVEPIKNRGKNVLGQPLDICGCEPMTGFYRTGCCETGPDDHGVHTICCVVDEPFLEATHENTLKIVPFELLIQYAVIPSQLH